VRRGVRWLITESDCLGWLPACVEGASQVRARVCMQSDGHRLPVLRRLSVLESWLFGWHMRIDPRASRAAGSVIRGRGARRTGYAGCWPAVSPGLFGTLVRCRAGLGCCGCWSTRRSSLRISARSAQWQLARVAPTLMGMGEADVPVGHVFVSYVREDARYADLLQRVLESAGVRVWRDTADLWPGEDWRAKIRHEITSNALVFVACFSRQSLAREVSYQNEELALAIDQMRLRRPDQPWLIPVRFDDCDIPELSVGGGRTLATIQRADLFGDRAGDAMQRLVAAVRRILGTNASGPRPGRPLSDLSDPFQFEVHPAIDAGASGLPVLPVRIPTESER
jgi:hypothetical protein